MAAIKHETLRTQNLNPKSKIYVYIGSPMKNGSENHSRFQITLLENYNQLIAQISIRLKYKILYLEQRLLQHNPNADLHSLTR